MVQANYMSMSHQPPGEPQLEDRIKATGYELADPTDSIPYPSNENVAYRASYSTSNRDATSLYEDAISAEKVVEQWMDSPGHRANILNPDYTYLGVGYGSIHDSEDVENYELNSLGESDRVTAFYTQVFATPESIDI